MHGRILKSLSVAAIALVAAGAGAAPGPVAYNWFEYAGRDAVFEKGPKNGHFQNPVLAGFYPDPSICRVGNDFYMVTSSFAFFPGVPVFHSKDLVRWEQIGHALDRATQLDLDGLQISEGIFAPTLRFYDGVFYLITTAVQGIGNFYVTATNPAGPWSEPKLLPFINGIDPSFFFDDNGRVYITHNGPPPDDNPLYEGHRAVWLWEVDLATNKPIGEGRIIINGGVDLATQPVWIEAPHILKKDGWYYLTCAEGGTSENHSQVVFRTQSLDNGWTPYPGNPILTQRDLPADRANPITSAGHADFVELPNGEWWSVFLAVRPYENGFFNTGRETYLLPRRWADGWPAILESGAEIPWQPAAPDLPKWEATPPPMTGNFVWRDDFQAPTLRLEWNFLRTPRGGWLSLDSKAGQLLVQPQTADLGGRGNPAWIGRRLQHARYDASAELRAPEGGVSAGLAALIREDHHYFLGVRAKASGYEVFLEKAENGPPEEVAKADFPGEVKLGDAISLYVVADKAEMSFFAQGPDGRRFPVAEKEDATVLTTAKAWGFVGAYLGPYARLEP